MTEEATQEQESFARRNRLWLILLLLLLLLLAAGLCASQVLGSQRQPAPTATSLPPTELPNEPAEAEPTAELTATAEPTVTVTAASTPTPAYSCNGVIGISYDGSTNWTASIDAPDIPLDGYYDAKMNVRPISCATFEQYPDRIFCDLNGFLPNTSWDLSVYDEADNLLCSDRVTIPPLPTNPSDEEGSSNGGGTCSPPPGGCNNANCEFWNSETCSCEVDLACIQ